MLAGNAPFFVWNIPYCNMFIVSLVHSELIGNHEGCVPDVKRYPTATDRLGSVSKDPWPIRLLALLQCSLGGSIEETAF